MYTLITLEPYLTYNKELVSMETAQGVSVTILKGGNLRRMLSNSNNNNHFR